MHPDLGLDPAPDGSIVATLGTEFNTESGDLFDRLLRALAETDVPSVVAVGRDLDPRRFGPQPSHVSVVQYADFRVLIPRAGAVLHHGGSGLFTSCVLGGVPQVVFPMGADQPFNADRVEHLGVGVVLDPLDATAPEIATLTSRLLGDTQMRARVGALRTEMLSLPDPSAIARLVENVVAARGA